MLYETLSQPLICIIFAICGFLCGFVFDIFNFIKFLCGNKKIITHIFDFVMCMIVFLIFYFINLNIMYGEIRLFSVFIFVVPFIIQRITLGKLLEKLYYICYNAFTKLTTKVVNRFHKKIKAEDKHE